MTRPFLLLILSTLLLSAAPKKKLSSFDPQVKELLARMTLDEKIGQMTQPDQESLRDPGEIETLFLGSLLSGGNSDPKAGNSFAAWRDMYDAYQSRALKTRLGIPILYGVDALHGHNNVTGAVIFPHNIGLGATRNAALVEKINRATALEVRATGIQWTFAPCVAVPQDQRWGRTYEGFSDDPALVAELGAAAVRGLQGDDLSNPTSVLACAKHFIGDGGTAWGSGIKQALDQGDTRVDEATLRRLHLPGYITALREGAATVMPSYSSWNGVKSSASEALMTGLLKKELGFEGFLISDYNALDQLHRDFKQAIAISINAGMDMVMITNRYRTYMEHLKALVNEGKVPMARIDDAVTRILRVKFAMGMMDKSRSQLADRKLESVFGSAAHRQLAREAVRQSLVLLKNENQTLPLKASLKRIHVAGRNADDIGNQCGGWTIEWQGKSGPVTTGGTTILAALKAAAKSTQITSGPDAKGADVAVLVIGEKPYAEMMGDVPELTVAKEDLDAFHALKQAGLPVVVVVVSGRPLNLGEIQTRADAIVAAWLPGTEGAGVADVLFGAYKPTGKLSFKWSDAMPRGYGLKY